MHLHICSQTNVRNSYNLTLLWEGSAPQPCPHLSCLASLAGSVWLLSQLTCEELQIENQVLQSDSQGLGLKQLDSNPHKESIVNDCVHTLMCSYLVLCVATGLSHSHLTWLIGVSHGEVRRNFNDMQIICSTKSHPLGGQSGPISGYTTFA